MARKLSEEDRRKRKFDFNRQMMERKKRREAPKQRKAAEDAAALSRRSYERIKADFPKLAPYITKAQELKPGMGVQVERTLNRSLMNALNAFGPERFQAETGVDPEYVRRRQQQVEQARVDRIIGPAEDQPAIGETELFLTPQLEEATERAKQARRERTFFKAALDLTPIGRAAIAIKNATEGRAAIPLRADEQLFLHPHMQRFVLDGMFSPQQREQRQLKGGAPYTGSLFDLPAPTGTAEESIADQVVMEATDPEAAKNAEQLLVMTKKLARKQQLIHTGADLAGAGVIGGEAALPGAALGINIFTGGKGVVNTMLRTGAAGGLENAAWEIVAETEPAVKGINFDGETLRNVGVAGGIGGLIGAGAGGVFTGGALAVGRGVPAAQLRWHQVQRTMRTEGWRRGFVIESGVLPTAQVSPRILGDIASGQRITKNLQDAGVDLPENWFSYQQIADATDVELAAMADETNFYRQRAVNNVIQNHVQPVLDELRAGDAGLQADEVDKIVEVIGRADRPEDIPVLLAEEGAEDLVPFAEDLTKQIQTIEKEIASTFIEPPETAFDELVKARDVIRRTLHDPAEPGAPAPEQLSLFTDGDAGQSFADSSLFDAMRPPEIPPTIVDQSVEAIRALNLDSPVGRMVLPEMEIAATNIFGESQPQFQFVDIRASKNGVLGIEVISGHTIIGTRRLPSGSPPQETTLSLSSFLHELEQFRDIFESRLQAAATRAGLDPAEVRVVAGHRFLEGAGHIDGTRLIVHIPGRSEPLRVRLRRRILRAGDEATILRTYQEVNQPVLSRQRRAQELARRRSGRLREAQDAAQRIRAMERTRAQAAAGQSDIQRLLDPNTPFATRQHIRRANPAARRIEAETRLRRTRMKKAGFKAEEIEPTRIAGYDTEFILRRDPQTGQKRLYWGNDIVRQKGTAAASRAPEQLLMMEPPPGTPETMVGNMVQPNVFESGAAPPNGRIPPGGGDDAPPGGGNTVFSPWAPRKAKEEFRKFLRGLRESLAWADLRRPTELISALNEFHGGSSSTVNHMRLSGQDILANPKLSPEVRRKYRKVVTEGADPNIITADEWAEIDPYHRHLQMLRNEIKRRRPELEELVDKLNDKYLPRLYWMFEAPNWRPPREVGDRAINFIAEHFTDGDRVAASRAVDDIISGKTTHEQLENALTTSLAKYKKGVVPRAARFNQRKVIPEPIRALMGEVDDGVFAAIRGIADLERNLLLISLADDILKNADNFRQWNAASPFRRDDLVTLRGMQKAGISIDQTNQTLLGGLMDEPIPRMIADDVIESITNQQQTKELITGLLGFGIQVKRRTMVTYNAGTWARNFVGNAIVFAPAAGNAPWRPGNAKFYLQALADIRHRNGRYDESLSSGALGKQFFDKEQQDVAERLGKLFLEESGDNASLDGAGWAQFTTKLVDFLDSLPRAEVGYDLIDKWFKHATYLKAREVGFRSMGNGFYMKKPVPMSARDAATHVNRYFPDYSQVGKFFREVSSENKGLNALIFNPFIAFNAEAARIWFNIVRYNPLAGAGIMGSLMFMANYGWSIEGITPSQWREAHRAAQPDRQYRPGYHRFPARLNIELPFYRDRNGDRHLLNMTWIIPGADLLYGFSIDPSRSTGENIMLGLASGMQNIFLGGFANEHRFQFDSLSQTKESAWPVHAQWGVAMWKAMAPTMLTHDLPEVARRVVEGPQYDTYGSTKTVGQAIAGTFGARTIPAGTPQRIRWARERMVRIGNFDKAMNELLNQRRNMSEFEFQLQRAWLFDRRQKFGEALGKEARDLSTTTGDILEIP